MSLTLTYDDTLARVTFAITAFDTNTPATLIERSLDNSHWTTVRGAVALPLSAGAVTGFYDYEFAPGVQNFYRASAAPKGLYFTPSLTGFAHTPDAATLDVTSNFEIRFETTISAWPNPSSNIVFLSKMRESTNNASYLLYLNTTGQLVFVWSPTGTPGAELSQSSTIPVPFTSGRHAVRVSANLAGGVITFYTADSLNGPWKQLGAALTFAASSTFSGNAQVEVGSVNNGGNADKRPDIVHGAQIIDSAGAFRLNVDFTAQTNHATSFVDSTGLTWTVHPNGVINTLVQTSSITPNMTRAWIKSVTRPFLNISVNTSCVKMGAEAIELLVDDGGVSRGTRNGVFPIIDRTYPVAVTGVPLGRQWGLRLRAWTVTAQQTLDYLFASGDVLFIQVPHNDCAETIEHGYVVYDTPSYVRHHRTRKRVVWQTAVTEVAAPGPDVAYRAATWQTILTQYGTWAAVMAANPKWSDVLALLPTPSEVIVP
jgi:hypothetical protein